MNQVLCGYVILPEIYKEPSRTPAGEWIFQILKKAFAQPPKFSTLERYLHHQQILLALGVDNEGNAEKCVHDDDFPGNPNPRHHFSLKGKVPHSCITNYMEVSSTGSQVLSTLTEILALIEQITTRIMAMRPASVKETANLLVVDLQIFQ
jgi:hypothetical protein